MSMSADVVFVAADDVFVFVGNDVDFLTLHCRLRRSIKNVNNIQGFAVKCWSAKQQRHLAVFPLSASRDYGAQYFRT